MQTQLNVNDIKFDKDLHFLAKCNQKLFTVLDHCAAYPVSIGKDLPQQLQPC